MKRLLQMGVVEHASSPWTATNEFVRKKDGTGRVTSDLRDFSALTIASYCPIEDMGATLYWMGSKRIFSTIDLKDGFFQVCLAYDSRNYIAIRAVIGLLRYVSLPQSRNNSPAVFQRLVTAILAEMKARDVWPFMDDIRLGTKTEEERLKLPGLSYRNIYECRSTAELSKMYVWGPRYRSSRKSY